MCDITSAMMKNAIEHLVPGLLDEDDLSALLCVARGWPRGRIVNERLRRRNIFLALDLGSSREWLAEAAASDLYGARARLRSEHCAMRQLAEGVALEITTPCCACDGHACAHCDLGAHNRRVKMAEYFARAMGEITNDSRPGGDYRYGSLVSTAWSDLSAKVKAYARAKFIVYLLCRPRA